MDLSIIINSQRCREGEDVQNLALALITVLQLEMQAIGERAAIEHDVAFHDVIIANQFGFVYTPTGEFCNCVWFDVCQVWHLVWALKSAQQQRRFSWLNFYPS